MKVGRAHNAVMVRRVVLGELLTKVSAAGFPINDKLAFPGAVMDTIEGHVDGFGFLGLIVPLANPSVVELSTCM